MGERFYSLSYIHVDSHVRVGIKLHFLGLSSSPIVHYDEQLIFIGELDLFLLFN